MAVFWLWVVRAPFAVAGLASLAAGAWGAFEWSLGLTGMALATFCADIAHHLGRRSERRARQKAMREALARAALVQQHMLEEQRGRRAA